MRYAPIALFAYKRLAHLARVIESLKQNKEANESVLFVFSDAARRVSDKDSVLAVRKYLASISGFNEVHLIERSVNYGLSRNIIDGVTQLCQTYGRVIVLEDDILVSPYFLSYMNKGLQLYAERKVVGSIHAYLPAIDAELVENFFLKGADCWGWATWHDRWISFEQDGRLLLTSLQERGCLSCFDMDNSYYYSEMLKDQIAGLNDSWAVRWHASCFIRGLLTLYPSRSLVNNIGNDGIGSTHAKRGTMFDTEVTRERIRVKIIDTTESTVVREAFVRFFNLHREIPWFIPYKVWRNARRLILRAVRGFYGAVDNVLK